MTTLPNLSTWHPVPLGATIPAGTPYAYAYENGVTADLSGNSYDFTVRDSGNPYYTEHPIAPPLPTEEGATIMASSGDWPPSVLLIREGDRCVTCFGVEWPADQIRAWAPVAIGETVVIQ